MIQLIPAFYKVWIQKKYKTKNDYQDGLELSIEEIYKLELP